MKCPARVLFVWEILFNFVANKDRLNIMPMVK